MKIRKRLMSAMLTVIMLCTLCVGSVLADDTAAKEEQVTIVFTHDLHSRLDEYKTEQGMAGGMARLKTRIAKKKAENPATFVFDGGDFSMGTLYQTIYETHAPELTMLGRVGYDAVTLGNHEFDYRAQGLANMLDSALENAKEGKSLTLPALVSASIDWEKNNSDENQLVKDALEQYGSTAYTIIDRGEVKVGVYGVFGEDAEACAPESGLQFEDIVETSKTVVEDLKEEGVDMIVCLSHSGTDENTKKSEDEILAKEVPEIDVIVSGHTHTTLEEPIVHGNTTIVSGGCYGKNLGELDLMPDGEGRWKLKNYHLEHMGKETTQDQEILALLEGYKAEVDDSYLSQFGYTYDQVLAENDVEFTNIDDFALELKEDALGNLISDSYVYAVEQAEGDEFETVDVAVVPAGVVRDSFQTGEITVADAFNVSSLGIGADRIPGYPLVSVYLTGAELKTAAEIDASISPIMTTAQLYPSGMRWVYNPNRMILNRVTEAALVNTKDDTLGKSYEEQTAIEIKDDQLYRVVAGLYSAQMLGAVEGQSMGLLKVTPKDKEGNPIEDFEQHIIHNQNGSEVKEWYALASYLESFEKNSDGISKVPARYESSEGRKVENDSKQIAELIKQPNKFAWMIYAVIALVILILVCIVLGVRKVRRKRKAGHRK